MRDTLDDLLDKRALDEMIYKAMHAMDSWDWQAYRVECLEDAVFDFTDHGVATDAATAVMKGADHYVGILASVIEGFDGTQHCVTNMVHVLDGEQASTRAYVYAEHFLNNDRGDRSVTCGGRYEITSRRTADGWKIASLKFKTLWFRGNTSLYALAGQTVIDRAKAKA